VPSSRAVAFWSATQGRWVDAGNLRTGELLRTSAGTFVQLSAVSRHQAQRVTYDLTVDTTHTYYVVAGSTPVLVHNCPNPAEGYPSYRGAGGWVSAQGEAGPGLTWEHVVEQSQMSPGRSGFPSEIINHPDNILSVTPQINFAKNYYYGSKLSWTGGMRLRDFLAGMSWDQQWDFGMYVIKQLETGGGLPR